MTLQIVTMAFILLATFFNILTVRRIETATKALQATTAALQELNEHRAVPAVLQ